MSRARTPPGFSAEKTAAAGAVALTLALASPAAALPDWTGLWTSVRDPDNPATTLVAFDPKPADLPVLTPKYKAIEAANRARLAEGVTTGDKTAHCEPPGMPLMMSIAYGGEILMTPGRVTIISEWAGDTRRIFTDGRPHPDDFEPSYEGHSIGHWEGDDLIVDTVGISPKASLNQIGTQQSDKMHIVERFHEYKPGFLEIAYRIEDPEAFQKPYTFKLTWTRNTDPLDYVREYHCDNNRDAARESPP
jgi:hypothetical protein